MIPKTPEQSVGAWASVILRLAIASLFIAAVVPKVKDGSKSMNATATGIQAMFKDTWLPQGMVAMHVHVMPYIEVIIPIWLIVGFRLKIGWIVTGLFLISLAFGMLVAQKGDVAAHNYGYVLISAIGLYLSRFDYLCVDGLLAKRRNT